MDAHLNVKMKTLEQREMKTEEKTMNLRTHLTELQKWDLAEGQSIEERRAEERRVLMAHQLEYNEKLVRDTKEKLPAVAVKKTAQGEPVQVQKPAKETYKQRRERARLEKEAKKATPMADDTSVSMVQDLRRSQLQRDNSYRALPKEVKQQAELNKVDVRVIKMYANGCKLNWMGRPATDRDAEARAADVRFFKDYISCDLERRRPHLDRMVEQALSIQVTPDMFAQEYLKDHAGEIYKKVNMLVCFDNIMKDPVNQPYFDELPQFTKDLIEQRIMSRYTYLGWTLNCACAQKAVNMNNASYMSNVRNMEQANDFHDMYINAEQEARAMMEDTSAHEQEAVQRELERRMELEKVREMETAEKMKAEAETMAGDIGGLNLTGYVTGYSFDELARYRKMIEEHPAEYAKNPQLIDALYQGLHHAIDALGDVTLRLMTAQGVIDELNKHLNRLTVTDRVVFDAAGQDQEKTSAEADLLRGQLSAHADAFQALLRGKPLSDPAKVLLRRMGHQV